MKIGTIVRVDRYGLCEVRLEDGGDYPRRTGFMLNWLDGYRGEPMKKFGIRKGAGVAIEEDELGRVKSARLIESGAHT